MTAFKTNSLLRHFRRAGPPALIAACLAAGPAFAQSSTTVVTPDQSDTTKTTIKEKPNGDTVVKQKETDRNPDVVVKEKTTVDQPSTTTTTTVR